jgi:hypothetical protein
LICTFNQACLYRILRHVSDMRVKIRVITNLMIGETCNPHVPIPTKLAFRSEGEAALQASHHVNM